MMLKLWRVILISISFVLFVSVKAQTSDELKRKYTLLENGTYLIRSHTLTVTFDDNGQACRMKMDPEKSSASNQYPIDLMSSKVADEIINELAPTSKRGKVLSTTSYYAGCSGVAITLYENVEISIASTCTPNGGGVTSVRIIWRNSKCWEEYQRKPPA